MDLDHLAIIGSHADETAQICIMKCILRDILSMDLALGSYLNHQHLCAQMLMVEI